MAKKAAADTDPTAFFLELATDYMKKFKGSPLAGERGVSLIDIASGFEKLAMAKVDGLDNIPMLKTMKSDVRVQMLRLAVKTFQGTVGLKRDGFFGRMSRGRLSKFKTCDEKSKPTQRLPTASNAIKTDIGQLHYYVEPRLANHQVSGGKSVGKLLANATRAWTKHLRLLLREVPDNKNDANIILKFDNLGGPGGTLGKADIGGRGVFNLLVLRFDENETWDEPSFNNTAMHELGHILGVKHEDVAQFSKGEPTLMGPTQDLAVQAPTPADILAMQNIWLKSPRCDCPLCGGGAG